MSLSLIIAALLIVQFAAIKWTVVLFALRLPSTIVHELAHWLVAFVLGCRPHGYSLIPRRIGPNSWRLGAVRFFPGPISTGFVALAPLWVLAPMSYCILWLRPNSGSVWTEVLAGLVGGIFAIASVPSKTDWSLAMRYPVGTLALLTLALMGLT